jgi:hypothetical protein
MTEARVGRLLAACLHQAILDTLPMRVEFYEHWLHPTGLRDGSIGLAPLTAVIGFLRTEGAADYDRVMTLAGRLAAEWTIASMSPFRRRVLAAWPRALRTRAALRVAAGIVHDVSSASRATVRIRRQSARLIVSTSLFCEVRDPQPSPLCSFYVGVAAEAMARVNLPVQGRIERCKAMGADACEIALER